MCPWKTPEADGEMITNGFELEPVAWQIVTCRCADSETARDSLFAASVSFDLAAATSTLTFFVVAAADSAAPHFAALCFSAWTSTSWGPHIVLCGWLFPGPSSVALPKPA